jgi:hypothetical protein
VDLQPLTSLFGGSIIRRLSVLTINPRIVIPALGLALLGMFIGNLAQARWPDRVQPHGVVTGAIAGILLGLLLGLYLIQQRRRWIAVAVIALLLIIAYVFGGPWNALFVAAAVFITLFISAGILRDLYGGNELEAFRHHLRIWLSMRGGFVVVSNGSIVVPTSPGPHFGPKLIIVRPGNAVVMVNGATISRICGPSIFMSANFEYVSSVLPIERQRRLLSMRDVLTQSYDPVGVQLTYVYGIDISAATIRGNSARTVLPDGARGLTEAEFDRLSNLVTVTPAWDVQVNRILQGATRNALALHEYTALTSLSYRRLAREIKLLADEQMREIGCCLDSVTVAEIAPAPEILDAHVDGVRIRTRHHAEGEGFRLAIVSVAVGYSEATKLGMSMQDIHREASRYMMEHMAEDPATKVVLALANPPTASEIQTPASIADELLDMDARNGDQPRAQG